jgi:hypothetical protein
MLALNTARVNFKHYGNASPDAIIRRHADRAEEFVRTLCLHAFGVNLETVSLLVFISNSEVRAHIERSQDALKAGELQTAMEELRLGFDLLVDDYINRKVWHPGKTLFSTKPSFMPAKHDLKFLGIEKLSDWIDAIDQWVRYLSLGIDMRRYAFFDAHAPRIAHVLNGEYHAYPREGVNLTDDVYKRSFKFVVDTALSFAAADFDFDAWAARRPTENALS